MQSLRNLKIWEKAHTLTLDICRASERFPRSEIYGLTSQLRRSSASIGRTSPRAAVGQETLNWGRFVQIVMGSAREVAYHLLLARDLALLSSVDYQRLDH